eukprot:TRINITY_DN8650_c0_g1_i2.p1 TRINITY_DN8650_c0_g1~~TRINITY_DN8650_c0_g1_i2.p1  ORF type:complete len:294 (-),score=47.50 TRINITY_DN8650_c0_g1_i2:75-956(-)
MNVQLTYKNTFIDALEGPTSSCGSVCLRSKSLPFPSRKSIQDEVMHESGYVAALMQRSEQLKLLLRVKSKIPNPSMSKNDIKMADVASAGIVRTALEERQAILASTVDTDTVLDQIEPKLSTSASPISSSGSASSLSGQPNACNPGSAGHPELCRRPCMFAATGNCGSGANCNFCHMDHKNQNLDKRLREQLRSLNDVERVSLSVCAIRERIESTGLSSQMSEILEIFEVWEASLPLPSCSMPNVTRLRKALVKLPLSVLIGHSIGHENDSNAHFHARVRDAMKRLRNSLSSC